MSEHIVLDYGPVGASNVKRPKKVASSLSGVAQCGPWLWTASDEGSTIERLRWLGDRYGDAQSFDLGRILQLPNGDDELDLEGLALRNTTLWMIGSHSATRAKPDAKPDGRDGECDLLSGQIERLARIEPRPRRRLLARLDLTADGSAPVQEGGLCLPFGAGRRGLHALLEGDPHLAPFLALPAKENGLDIEGIAAGSSTIMVGLRGPVLRGEYAVILELRLDAHEDHLRARTFGNNGPRYRKHFVELDGCGVRDLHAVGDDLVILAGPTMGNAGSIFCRVWPKALAGEGTGDSFVAAHALQAGPPIHPQRAGNPEAIGDIMHPDGRRGWIVLRDYPDRSKDAERGIDQADFIPI